MEESDAASKPFDGTLPFDRHIYSELSNVKRNDFDEMFQNAKGELGNKGQLLSDLFHDTDKTNQTMPESPVSDVGCSRDFLHGAAVNEVNNNDSSASLASGGDAESTDPHVSEFPATDCEMFSEFVYEMLSEEVDNLGQCVPDIATGSTESDCQNVSKAMLQNLENVSKVVSTTSLGDTENSQHQESEAFDMQCNVPASYEKSDFAIRNSDKSEVEISCSKMKDNYQLESVPSAESSSRREGQVVESSNGREDQVVASSNGTEEKVESSIQFQMSGCLTEIQKVVIETSQNSYLNVQPKVLMCGSGDGLNSAVSQKTGLYPTLKVDDHTGQQPQQDNNKLNLPDSLKGFLQQSEKGNECTLQNIQRIESVKKESLKMNPEMSGTPYEYTYLYPKLPPMQTEFTTVRTENTETKRLYPNPEDICNDFTEINFVGSKHWSHTDYDINNSSVRNRAVKSTRSNKTTENKSSSTADIEQTNVWFSVIALLFGSIIVVCLLYYIIFRAHPSSNNVSFEKFTSRVGVMEQDFTNQNKHLWKTVKASAYSILGREQSNRPAVLLMAATISHNRTASCIARRVSADIESLLGSPKDVPEVINIDNLSHLDAATQKMQLDNFMNSAFAAQKRKVVIIENLQLLHPAAALLFYNYCDGDNAAFKDVMILFTLYFNETVEKIDSLKSVEDHLKKVWSEGLSIDKVNPLLSRVANNIAVVQGEDSAALNNVCH